MLKDKSKQEYELYEAILTLRTKEECERFLKDLCTIKEMQAIVQRYEVVRLLDRGKVYSDIAKETGASSATISRVNRCLQYGDGGYRMVLDRLPGKDKT